MAWQGPATIFRHSFNNDVQGWAAMGQGGAVRAVEGQLAFEYEIGKGFNAAVLAAPASLASLRRLRFRIRTDHATAIAVLLSEKKPGGGDYSALFWSPADTWQTIELAPEDFAANDGPRD